VTHLASRGIVGAALIASLLACAGPAPTAKTSARNGIVVAATCEQAYAAWVGTSGTVNTPGTDPIAIFLSTQPLERRVFELCSLDEAERHNREMIIRDAPGTSHRLLDPDVRTFAEVECVDDAELIGGTPLCAEVSK
jgi:hypothetical protein